MKDDIVLPPPVADTADELAQIDYEDTLQTGEAGYDGTSGSNQQFIGASSSSSGSGASGGSGAGGSGGAAAGGDKGAAGKGKGKGKSTVFGNTLDYDKTLVYSIMPDKEHGVFYKVQVIPTNGKDSEKIGNDHLHEKTLDAIVTAVNIRQGVRQQINYTLGNTAYLYVFGESVVELIIGGFGFWKCNTGNDKFKTPDAILDFYKTNNVSKEGKYCKVLLGDRTFKGYLIDSDIGFTERELGLVSFRLSFIGVFQDNG